MKNIIIICSLILTTACCFAQDKVVEQRLNLEISLKPSTVQPTVTKANPNVVPMVTAQQWKPGDPEPTGISYTIPAQAEPSKNNTPTATPDVNHTPETNIETIHLTLTPESSLIEVRPKAIKAEEQDK